MLRQTLQDSNTSIAQTPLNPNRNSRVSREPDRAATTTTAGGSERRNKPTNARQPTNAKQDREESLTKQTTQQRHDKQRETQQHDPEHRPHQTRNTNGTTKYKSQRRTQKKKQMLEGHSETTSHKPTTKQTHGRKGEHQRTKDTLLHTHRDK